MRRKETHTDKTEKLVHSSNLEKYQMQAEEKKPYNIWVNQSAQIEASRSWKEIIAWGHENYTAAENSLVLPLAGEPRALLIEQEKHITFKRLESQFLVHQLVDKI